MRLLRYDMAPGRCVYHRRGIVRYFRLHGYVGPASARCEGEVRPNERRDGWLQAQLKDVKNSLARKRKFDSGWYDKEIRRLKRKVRELKRENEELQKAAKKRGAARGAGA